MEVQNYIKAVSRWLPAAGFYPKSQISHENKMKGPGAGSQLIAKNAYIQYLN
jgi:hypothetical protein